MLMADLRAQLREIIAEIGEVDDPDTITEDADLFEDLDLDSMQAMEIVLEIERQFGVQVQEADLSQIRSLGAAARVAERLKGSGE